MLWDPFLIKKLLKSVICGIVNSAWIYCLQLTKSTIAAEKKKKKKRKRKTQLQKRRRRNNLDPNGHLVSLDPASTSIVIAVLISLSARKLK